MTTASAELLACANRLVAEVRGMNAFEHDVRAVISNTNWSCLQSAAEDTAAALTRAVQPASKPVGDGGAVRDALATLIKYAVWQVKEGADHHPTLPSAIAQAGAALAPPSQPAADAERAAPAAGDVERLTERIKQYRARLECDHHYISFAGAQMERVDLPFDEDEPYDGIACRDETIKLLESHIAELKAALAAPAPAPDTCPHCIDERDCANVPICAAVAETYAAPPPDAVAVPKEMIEMVIGRIDHVHNWLAGWQHFEQCDHLLLARKALDRARSAAHTSPGDGSTGGRG